MTLRAIHEVPAPAKLNLFLHVVGRRPDGYHLLQSVFVLLDWCDTLHFERRADGRLQRHDLGPTLPADDLCLRAARALQQASGCTLGADIHIDKQVPWGAGLGGGSSDAASTLLTLNRLWDLHWPRQRLLDLAPGQFAVISRARLRGAGLVGPAAGGGAAGRASHAIGDAVQPPGHGRRVADGGGVPCH